MIITEKNLDKMETKSVTDMLQGFAEAGIALICIVAAIFTIGIIWKFFKGDFKR